MILFNPFGDSFTFSPLVLVKNVGLFNATGWAATTPSDTGWSNQITYTTPKFGGLSGNTVWYNVTLGLAMLIGRFLIIVPAMALAGSLVTKKSVPESAGTLPTHGPLFVALLLGVILIVGGLEFFPALALGPIVEHLAMIQGQSF